MIGTAEQTRAAQLAVANLKNVLPEARKVHSPQDYARLAEPILVEIRQREQGIPDYLSGNTEQRVTS